MKHFTPIALLGVSLGALAITVPHAYAQDASSASDIIVVTGQKALDFTPDSTSRLGLSNRETPAIIDVLTQEDFQAQGVRSAIDAMNATPGVNAGNLPGAIGGASIRGFTRGAINYLYDGVRMASSGAEIRNWDSWSFERIEVLKGPASVISGEGALAGAINFVPRRAQLGASSGGVLVSYGSQDSVRFAGGANAALGEHAAARGDLAYSRSAGWVNGTDSETRAVNLSLRGEPTDRLSVVVSADRFEDDFSTAYFGLPLVPRTIARAPSGIVFTSTGAVADEAMRDLNFNVDDGTVNSQSTWLRAKAEYRVSDSWKLVSDTSWYQADRMWRNSEDFTFNAGTGLLDRTTTLITHDHQYWNERLHAAFDGTVAGYRNRFTAGVEFGSTDFATSRRFGASTAVNPFTPTRGLFPATDTAAVFPTRQEVAAEVEASAVFMEDAFNLTPDWLFVGGARYDHVELSRRIDNLNTNTTVTYGNTYDPVSWRIGTVYSVRAQTQVFAQYSSAVTPVSGLLFISAANAAFDLSTGASLEAGVKTALFGGRGWLTASAFQIQQDDILTRDPVNPAITVQGGSQRSRGVEVSLSWDVTDELSVEGGAALLDAAFEELREAGGVDRSGNRPANTPEQTFDLVTTYAPHALPVSFTGSVRHTGDIYTSNANTVRIEGFTLIDAAVTWRAPFGAVTLRGRNLTDAFYADWSGFSATQIYVGAPRSFEVSVTRSF